MSAAKEYVNHRKKKVITYGVSKTEGEVVANKVEEALSQWNEESLIQDCSRLLIDEECYIMMYIITICSYNYNMYIITIFLDSLWSFEFSWHKRIMYTILID